MNNQLALKFMRSIVGIILTFSLAFTIPIASMAASSGNNISRSASSSLSSKTQGNFKELFKADLNDTSVNYSFTINESKSSVNSENTISSDKATTTLNFDISAAKDKYSFCVNGDLSKYRLSNGKILYEGALTGENTVNGIKYNVIVGMQKLSNSDNICATVNMIPSETRGKQVLFIIGSPILTDEDVAQFKSRVIKTNKTDLNKSNYIFTNDLLNDVSLNIGDHIDLFSYGWGDSNLVYMNSPYSGIAQIITKYYDTDNNKVAISATSNTDSVNNYFASMYDSAGTSISTLKVGLKRTVSNNTYIAGIEDLGQLSGTANLWFIVGDLIGLLPTGGSMFEYILSQFDSSISVSSYTNNSYANFTFGIGEWANFESLSTILC